MEPAPPSKEAKKSTPDKGEAEATTKEDVSEIAYTQYEGEHQLHHIQKLIEKDLSEPYSIYTYRYFLNNWPKLCYMAWSNGECVGTIVCKLDKDKKGKNRGYIAMLAVEKSHRKRGIGSKLVKLAVNVMIELKADMVVLETEITNKGALSLYANLGFVRDKRLHKYYMNGVDAFRKKLWLTPPDE
eukprot:CAMPEP_0170168218 /NCGR_PEP_ID=MMETSP0040_2-20121228/1345_1 /TAXON_ID=641309 /ORGANISM="Lotharella oceanica, Strain CCMP622" /LENGTH=184 /DNA_ID=CAMNT_0010406421 /DNA_START=16 /DNA_END=570 /DNA_ORIENTATION=+